MKKYSIGQFDFIDMSRVPSKSMTQLEREVRPGVDNATVWNTGARGEPFQMMTTTDADDADAARSLIEQYEFIVGEVVDLWWNGLRDTAVLVHHVEPLPGGVHATLLGIGGRLGSSHGMARAIWTLEYWPVGPTQQQ